MSQVLLVLNAGSSTLKFRAFRRKDCMLELFGQINHFGAPSATLTLTRQGGMTQTRRLSEHSVRQCTDVLVQALAEADLQIEAAIHRVVHGGGKYSGPVLLDPVIRKNLEALIPLAPLHQPASLAVIDSLHVRQPSLPQIACFDTAFHSGGADRFSRFAIARHWHEAGVKRYGFHGLSYASIARRLSTLGLDKAKVVVCHLGGGASACALNAGQSVAASTGFSAVDGLMMGTRPGTLDPEVVLYWIEQKGMSVPQVREELYRKSGLLGVSGVSSDMRTLLASDRPEAAEAINLFCDRAAREVASLATALEGLDALIFTAGIGEHSPEIRARILKRLAWLGFELDEEANNVHAVRISTKISTRSAWVLAADEEGEMLREGLSLLNGETSAEQDRDDDIAEAAES